MEQHNTVKSWSSAVDWSTKVSVNYSLLFIKPIYWRMLEYEFCQDCLLWFILYYKFVIATLEYRSRATGRHTQKLFLKRPLLIKAGLNSTALFPLYQPIAPSPPLRSIVESTIQMLVKTLVSVFAFLFNCFLFFSLKVIKETY